MDPSAANAKKAPLVEKPPPGPKSLDDAAANRDAGGMTIWEGSMKYAIAALVPAIMLAGCNKGVEMKNASADEVAAATKNANFIKPGKWTNTSEVIAVNLEGMPPEAKEMADAMSKSMVGRKNSFESCVTEEEAKKPNGKMFAGNDKGNCVYDTFSMGGGKFDAVMTCTPTGGPGKINMTMKGDYGDEAYSFDVEMKVAGSPDAPESMMTIKAKNSGVRKGECEKPKA